MKVFKILKIMLVLMIGIQFLTFIFVKQKFVELERRSLKLENEINSIMNENTVLKVKITTMQNSAEIKKLVTRYLPAYRYMKPNQIIEKDSI